MTEMVKLCGVKRDRTVYHTQDCNAVAQTIGPVDEVPIDEVDDDFGQCGHCQRLEQSDPVDHDPDYIPSPMHYGGTLSVDSLYPDCRECGADGVLYVVRSTRRLIAEAMDGDWECLRCGELFDVGPSSRWYGVFEMPEEIAEAHVEVNIREADPSVVASAKNTPADTLVERAERAKDELRSVGMVAADD